MTDLNRDIFEGALRNLKQYDWSKGAYSEWNYDVDEPRSFCVLGAVAYTLGYDPENEGACEAFIDSMAELDAMAEWVWEQNRGQWEWALNCPWERDRIVNMLTDVYDELDAEPSDERAAQIKRISWEMSQAENYIEIQKHRKCEEGEICKAGMTRFDGSPLVHGDHIYNVIDYYVNLIAGWNDWDDTTFDEITDLLVSL